MNLTFLVVSIIEIIYIIYFFNYFKTTVEFHHPFECIITGLSEYLKHPMGTGVYENKICKFGNYSSYLFALYGIARYIAYTVITLNKMFGWMNVLKKINIIIIAIAVGLSLIMNLNAFIYILPIVILEVFYINKQII